MGATLAGSRKRYPFVPISFNCDQLATFSDKFHATSHWCIAAKSSWICIESVLPKTSALLEKNEVGRFDYGRTIISLDQEQD